MLLMTSHPLPHSGTPECCATQTFALFLSASEGNVMTSQLSSTSPNTILQVQLITLPTLQPVCEATSHSLLPFPNLPRRNNATDAISLTLANGRAPESNADVDWSRRQSASNAGGSILTNLQYVLVLVVTYWLSRSISLSCHPRW